MNIITLKNNIIRHNIIQHYNIHNNDITLQNDLIRNKHNIIIIQNNITGHKKQYHVTK